MKGLVETNHNADYANEQNLSASSPVHTSDIDNPTYENNHGLLSQHISDRSNYSISRRFDDINEPLISYSKSDHDRKDDLDSRLDMSPITDQPSRKRRKLSSCDTPLLPLQPLSRHPSESQVRVTLDEKTVYIHSQLISVSTFKLLISSIFLNRRKEILNNPLHVNSLTFAKSKESKLCCEASLGGKRRKTSSYYLSN